MAETNASISISSPSVLSIINADLFDFFDGVGSDSDEETEDEDEDEDEDEEVDAEDEDECDDESTTSESRSESEKLSSKPMRMANAFFL